MIKNIFVTYSALKDKVTVKILEHHSEANIYEISNNHNLEKIKADNPKENLLLTHSKGDVIKACPGTAKEYLCCRYQIINQTLNCPFNCTYCILQYYLNQKVTIIYTDFQDIFSDLSKALKKHNDRLIRVGTGELGDSLALYGSRLFTRRAIKFFSHKNNALFEIKTKSNQIKHILNMQHNRRTVISWSLNPKTIAEKEEINTSRINERLKAAKECEKAGFLLGFHFDPILKIKKWRHHYKILIDKLYSTINPKNIIWISMGSLRFPTSMKEKIIEHYPKTRIVYEEMIKGLDGKLRYARPVRIPLYKFIYKNLNGVSNPPFIYFCMENKTIWQEIIGFAPKNNAHLDWMFADSIYKRFDDIITESPKIKTYNNCFNLDGSKFVNQL